MKRDEQEAYLAGFGIRLFAWLTDMAILALPLGVLRGVRLALGLVNPAGLLVRDVFFHYSLIDIAVYGVSTLYFVLMTYFFGGTLGKYLLRLRVVSTQRRDLTLREVVVREVFGRYLSGVVFMIGYLGILVDPEKRALHDMIADTQVIYAQGEKLFRPDSTEAASAPSVPAPTALTDAESIAEPEPFHLPETWPSYSGTGYDDDTTT